ncbi:MAG TPA: glycoside hydrolase family 3 C-terminal domain-containing protein [Terracidiphilus sp.]|nr:glycoside hydrolase family 3 C-terminal domain-containing protein [Terracidiphilus sp.]
MTNHARLQATIFAMLLVFPLSGIAGQQTSKGADAQRPWMDTSLPIDQRVDDLIGKMTLEEKVQQMRDHAPAIPRLGVPKYDWWNEGLHGVAFSGYATNFPQVIGMAATWDAPLVHRMAETISTEARAKYNQAMRENDHEAFFGLTFWAPNINIFRDPRWGRGQETYGEDPFLAGQMAVAFVTGMQGDDPRRLKVVSTPKHFDVHSGPESTRHQANVDISNHDLEDTYLPAFRAAVTRGHAQSVMCAYNAIDGAPACANTMLLKDHLRDAWHFDGYVVSDCAAVADIFTGHHYASDMAHAAADAVKAGTDLECGYMEGQAFPSLVEAVHENLIGEKDIDRALHRLYRARFRLGMFDPPSSYAYGRIGMDENNTPAHRQLSLDAARESMVLLKNNGVLPLKAGVRKIAVIGPTAELVQSLQGNYNGPPPNPVYPLAGIEKRFKAAQISYAMGSSLDEGFAMPIEHTALHPSEGSGEFGLKGEYFPSPDLSGAPVLTRVDRNVNFNWDKVIPVKGLQRNNYSVRWTGAFTPPAAGDYRLGVRINYCYACENAEDFRLYLDGKLMAQSTGKSGERGEVFESSVHFDNTQSHAIRLEYFHKTGTAGIDLTWQAPAEVLRDEAVAQAKNADVIVACLGLSPSLEGEEMPVKLEGFSGGDRTDIVLPAVQEDLLKALVATGKPVVVVLQNGSALAVNYAAEHAAAVLEAWYPGEEGGTAIAETLAGENNPAGRLPITFYRSLSQLPPFDDYAMKGRTYRYMTEKPLYPFGYGLSYTTFSYSEIRLAGNSVKAGDSVHLQAQVKNTGSAAGDEVAELYLVQPQTAVSPRIVLAGFKRVHLEAGKSAEVDFTLDPRTMSEADADGNHVILPGEYKVYLGGAQPGGEAQSATAIFTVNGRMELPN